MKKYWCHSIIFMHFWQFDNKGLVQITSLKITVESENFCNACSNLSKWFVSYVCIQMFFQLAIFSKRLFTNQAFSWTALTCLFREPFSPNDWLQIKQVNGLSFSWTVLIWFLENFLTQMIACKASKWMVYHFHELFLHVFSDWFFVQMIVANQASKWFIIFMKWAYMSV